MNTSEKLKALREQKSMSQADCAKAMNIDRTTYAKYENGGSIRRNVEKLANFFNVSVDYLLDRTDAPVTNTGAENTSHSSPLTANGTNKHDLADYLAKSDELYYNGTVYKLNEADKAVLKNFMNAYVSKMDKQ